MRGITMKRSSLWIMFFLVCSLILTVARQNWADNVYGAIRGVVIDQSGAVVPGAKVVVTDVNTGISRQAVTGPDGTFVVLNLLAPATYNVKVQQDGFRKFESRDIHLNVNQVYVVHATLEVGAATQQITAQIDTTSMQLGVSVTGKQIVDLPLNGRNWVQLQQLEPGVVAAADARGSYATNGSEAEQNSYLINGTDDNDLVLNTVLVVPSPDAIAEFRLVTSTINPEYGRNSGAIMNAVIKSGTNQFHGDGFDFYRDTSLNARNFFQPKPAVFHQNQFGGTIGGPIWKNHTFFFFSYQGTRNR